MSEINDHIYEHNKIDRHRRAGYSVDVNNKWNWKYEGRKFLVDIVGRIIAGIIIGYIYYKCYWSGQ